MPSYDAVNRQADRVIDALKKKRPPQGKPLHFSGEELAYMDELHSRYGGENMRELIMNCDEDEKSAMRAILIAAIARGERQP